MKHYRSATAGPPGALCRYREADVSRLQDSARRKHFNRCLYQRQLRVSAGELLRSEGPCVQCGEPFVIRKWRSERCPRSECWDQDPYVALSQWAAGLTPRETSALRGRVAAPPDQKVHLKTLGQRHGVTGERMRQVAALVSTQLGRFLNSSPGRAAVRPLVNVVGGRLGIAAPMSALDGVLPPPGDPALDLSYQLILNLAGPYYQTNRGWVTRKELSIKRVTEKLLGLADRHGAISSSKATRVLGDCGLPQSLHAEFLEAEPKVRFLDSGRLVRWDGNVADKAIAVLLDLGEPATAENLMRHMGENKNSRHLKDKLSKDDRAHRTTRSLWVLASWGMPEYHGIVAFMKAELDSAGGSLLIGELLKRASAAHGINERSIRGYAHAATFVYDKGGVRLRREGESFSFDDVSITTAKGLYDLGKGRAAVLLSVDRNTLRGSGLSLPLAVGKLLRVNFGERRSFVAPRGGTLAVLFDPSSVWGVNIGSTRFLAEHLGAGEGDLLTLLFDTKAGTVTPTLTPPHFLPRGWGLVERLTGVPAPSGIAGLAAAIHTTPGAARSVLRMRGDMPVLRALSWEEDMPSGGPRSQTEIIERRKR